jgi:hypothetical protein
MGTVAEGLAMYRSFYVVWRGVAGYVQREDYEGVAGFAGAFGRYCALGRAALYGVDSLDRSCLLGERGPSDDTLGGGFRAPSPSVN